LVLVNKALACFGVKTTRRHALTSPRFGGRCPGGR